jgi:hypothetical protein
MCAGSIELVCGWKCKMLSLNGLSATTPGERLAGGLAHCNSGELGWTGLSAAKWTCRDDLAGRGGVDAIVDLLQSNSWGTILGMSISSSKPAQVILAPLDQERSRNLKKRLLDLDLDPPGTTALFRAGLVSLTEASDETLLRLMSDASNRSSSPTLAARFEQWCDDIAREVVDQAAALKDAQNRRSGTQPGSFSYAGRYVVLSLIRGGRVSLDGWEQRLEPLQPGERVPEDHKLFDGLPGTELDMNQSGAAFASRVIVAWLMRKDDVIEEIRSTLPRNA